MSLTEKLRKDTLKTFFRQALNAFILAFILNFIVEALSARTLLPVIKMLFHRPWVFLYNSLIICLTLAPALCVKRRMFTQVLVSAVWIVLGIVNCVTRIMRITPLGFYDFVIFVENFSITNSYVTAWQMALIILAIVLLLAGLVIFFRRGPKAAPCRRLGLSNMALLAALIALATIPYAVWARDYADPSKGYERFGFAYSLVRSAVDRGIDRPETYGEAAIDTILAAGEDDIVSASAAPTPNFIFLQLESFVDPKLYNTVACSENPIPTFTWLKENCQSGYLHVPMIGGGTANVEFEVLTGMRLHDFGTGEYPYSTVLKNNSCESVAHDLRRIGYAAHAIHSNTATFYQRHKVFESLGFDTFTSLEYMYDYTANSLGWCRDKHLTAPIMEALKSSEARDLVFTVSVQGHGKYDANEPKIPYAITTTGLEDTPALKNEFEYYVQQLSETDAFLSELLSALESYPEPVVLVVYGDHLPALNLPEDSLKTGSYLITEYAIWTNFTPLIPEEKDLYAYQLTSYALGRYGIDGGVLMRYHQQASGNEDYLERLQELEYDMLYGDKFLYGGGSPYERADMRLGLRDIAVASARWDEKVLVVRGENFTRASVVYVNGSALETYYIDSGILAAVPGLLGGVAPGDSVTVSQLAADGTVLSSTETAVCE